MTTATGLDRAAALRAAVRAVVAERGLHGASVSRIAAAAGVAAGTVYVHYRDKDDLVLAAYVEAKHTMGAAAVAAGRDLLEAGAVEQAFVTIWLGVHEHLRANPGDAAFLVAVDASPLWSAAHDQVLADGGDPLAQLAASPAVAAAVADLPEGVVYELGLAPAVRLAARGTDLPDGDLRATAAACWRAIAAD